MSPPARRGRGHPRSCEVSGGLCGFGAPHFWVPPVGLQGWALCWGWAQLSSRHTQGPRVLLGWCQGDGGAGGFLLLGKWS